MKMPRSQCEAGNVQFVQELAEVDGPFEAPININFRDLTKLELPSLVWNRSDACPRKMKITNTGHTVIVSGKWKCERPYLTGGPLLGKYVFSQIHFHWGQTDCRGSEHQVCGEEFPLEMHVAHFKTEYMTQENALREKDGMVVVVYLFKLQDEPNQSLKKIINSLPKVKQPSTSFAIDPRPILSLCNPFTDDYFMYWGSVVTSTCAHILLWIICREPFGISREQVCEFRKIMDSSQQPISKNSREVQPLHKRNVFHVNASKHLDEPLLPIKRMIGCYCKHSKDALNTSNTCHCQGAYQNQEDVEGGVAEHAGYKGVQFNSSCFANQTFVVQTATVQSMSVVLKRPGSDPIKHKRSLHRLKKVKSETLDYQVKLASKSCCFFPTEFGTENLSKLKEKKKVREKKKLFNSMKAFTQIMQSLDALKKQTFKKLKNIESINQEIKEMKPFCQDTEDKKWIRKIEKMILRQKRFTINSSQGCLSELRKLAKDCNFDKYFDTKALPASGNSRKMMWLSNSLIAPNELPCCDTLVEDEEIHGIKNQTSKHFDVGKAIKFSSEAQKLIESFFEDIKEADELKEAVENDPKFQKIKSLCSVEGDLVSSKNKGYITQKMFNLGNLGDRFFTEVTSEDMKLDENWDCEDQNEEVTMFDNLKREPKIDTKLKTDDVIPLHRVNIPISVSKDEEEEEEEKGNENLETSLLQNLSFRSEKNIKLYSKKASRKTQNKKSSNEEKYYDVADEKPMKVQEPKISSSTSQTSSSISTTSTEPLKTIIKKPRKSKKSLSIQSSRKSSIVFRISSKKLHAKTSSKKFETPKVIEKKSQKDEDYESFDGLTSSNEEEEEEEKENVRILEQNKATKAKLEKSSAGEPVSEILSVYQERKKLATENGAVNLNRNVHLTMTETRTIITNPSEKYKKFESIKQTNYIEEESPEKLLKGSFLEEQEGISLENTGSQSKTTIKSLTSRTYRASSADSKARTVQETEEKQADLQSKNTIVKTEILNLLEKKPLSKTSCRSLTNVTSQHKTESIRRLQLETINSRKKTNEDQSTGGLKEKYKTTKDSPAMVSSETHKNLKEEQKKKEAPESREQKDLKSPDTLEDEVEFSTENSSQLDDEFFPNIQIKEEKGSKTTTKEHEEKIDDRDLHFNKEPLEVLRLTDSEKSFERNTSLGDTLGVNRNNFKTSFSYSAFQNDATSRPLSAGTLDSHKMTQRKKNKKRPHCSKRSSRHYIRRNYSTFKKPSKQFNFLNLTSEEQLKIISLNVAKYIKRKLIEEKDQPEPEKKPSDEVKEEIQSSTALEKKPEETPVQRTTASNSQKVKKLRIPVLKSVGRSQEKEKILKAMNKPNTVETLNETNVKKSKIPSPTKPSNNFILLNKQKASTYKRSPQVPVKKNELKEKEKPKPDTKRTDKGSKIKASPQKKTEESSSAQKPVEKPRDRPQTPSSTVTQATSPKGVIQKERKLKEPLAVKKLDSNVKKTKKPPDSPKTEKPNESAGVKNKSEPEKSSPSPKVTPRSKIPVVSPNAVDSNPTAVSIAKTPSVENFNLEENKYDIISRLEEENKNQDLLKKELEHFITMQMYINNKISDDIDNPLHFFKSKILNSDSNKEENPLVCDPPENLELTDRDIFVMKKNNFDEISSSCSELLEQSENFKVKDLMDDKIEDIFNSKNIMTVKAPIHDSFDLGLLPVRKGSQDSPSDSSYDCKISITLNTNLGPKENTNENNNENDNINDNNNENENEVQDSDKYLLGENYNSLTTTSLVESCSQLADAKMQINKGIESEISFEMKQKLLEILEGEIQREIGISCGVSSGNSSDALVFKGGDSEGNLRSQSTESSSDNIEAIAQISSTMKQYLTYLREMKQLSDESKDYEEF